MNNLLTPIQTKGTLMHGVVGFNQFNGNQSDLNVTYHVVLVDEAGKETILAEQTYFLPYNEVSGIMEASVTKEDIGKNFKEITLQKLSKHLVDKGQISIV